jgi:hypothetical protein
MGLEAILASVVAWMVALFYDLVSFCIYFDRFRVSYVSLTPVRLLLPICELFDVPWQYSTSPFSSGIFHLYLLCRYT